MRKWAEVIDNRTLGADGQPSNEIMAALDVTGEADGGETVMADLKTIYPGLRYRWHYCEHNRDGICRTEEVA